MAAPLLDVAIYGAGGLGRMVRDILAQAGTYRPVAFLDSDPAMHRRVIDGLPVCGDLSAWDELARHGVGGAVVAIGDNTTRLAIARRFAQRGITLVSAIHPLASIALSAQLGPHLIVGARVNICVHARIGAHCVLSPGTIVEHDNRLGDGVFVDPAVRLAGGVTVEAGAWIGIGACIIPGRRVGAGACVEPGAVVIRDVPAHTTVGGAPAVLRTPGPSSFHAEPPASRHARRSQLGPGGAVDSGHGWSGDRREAGDEEPVAVAPGDGSG
jgi:sugar O-acyltransferase (sialic acid O-acetyltransferase NeuD family)